VKLPKLIYHGRSHASCHSRTNIHQRILFPSTQAPTLHYLSATLKRKADQSQHLIFKRNMRPSFYAAAALATSGLQASALALPAHDRSFIDLVSPGQAEPSNLDERSINWWPATNCVSQISKAQKKERKKTSTIPNPSQPTDLLHFHLPRRSRRAKLVVRRLETTPREPHHHFLDVS
jgi:hypothetical protein